MNLVPIVEGHGEVSAAPVLLRRIAHSNNRYDVVIPQPIRIKRQRIAAKFRELERAIALALGDPATDAILLLLDAEDDCPAELAPELLERSTAVCQGKPMSVVLAMREFEAWFLAGIESLRGRRGISQEATYSGSSS
jgi:hypothetical protein